MDDIEPTVTRKDVEHMFNTFPKWPNELDNQIRRAGDILSRWTKLAQLKENPPATNLAVWGTDVVNQSGESIGLVAKVKINFDDPDDIITADVELIDTTPSQTFVTIHKRYAVTKVEINKDKKVITVGDELTRTPQTIKEAFKLEDDEQIYLGLVKDIHSTAKPVIFDSADSFESLIGIIKDLRDIYQFVHGPDQN